MSRLGSVGACIATYRRPEQLAALLDDLSRQSLKPDEIIVVDNDAAGSASAVVRHFARDRQITVRYAIQPQKNISLTRNLGVALTQADWLAFIDDDERAPPCWLATMAESALLLTADGVLGPVEPVIPADAPTWIKRGRFYHWPRLADGSLIPPNRLRLGNALIRGALLRGEFPPFNPVLGLTGGEDGDMLGRLCQEGARFFWCDRAEVFEPVDQSRLSLRWLLLRAMRGGQDFARHRLSGRYGPIALFGRGRLVLRATAQMLGACILALLFWPLGRHRAVHWLTKVAANFGKLSTLFGMHYREYA